MHAPEPCDRSAHTMLRESQQATPSYHMAKASTRPPLPGTPVRGSRTARAVTAPLGLLGPRWALRILWELRDEPATTFRDLQVRCGDVSSSVLNQRLRELRGGGIIAIGDPNGYQLA